MSTLLSAVSEPGSQPALEAVGIPSLFLLVTLGSLVPVVPTGALVSSAAVVGFHARAPFTLLIVFGVAAFAAFLGDAALYWAGRRGMRSKGGSRWLHRLQERADPGRIETAQRQLERNTVAVLVISRLVPAGRLPVMVAFLLAEVDWRRFVRGDAVACLAWAALYQAIGILGGSLFPKPWQGVAAAVTITVLISTAPRVYRYARGPRPTRPAEDPSRNR